MEDRLTEFEEKPKRNPLLIPILQVIVFTLGLVWFTYSEGWNSGIYFGIGVGYYLNEVCQLQEGILKSKKAAKAKEAAIK